MADEADDLYSDGGAPTVVEETESEETVEETSEADEKVSESAGTPALLPKGFFSGKDLKPGTVCEVKVEKVTDGQVLVSYKAHSKGGDDEELVEETSEVDELMA